MDMEKQRNEIVARDVVHLQHKIRVILKTYITRNHVVLRNWSLCCAVLLCCSSLPNATELCQTLVSSISAFLREILLWKFFLLFPCFSELIKNSLYRVTLRCLQCCQHSYWVFPSPPAQCYPWRRHSPGCSITSLLSPENPKRCVSLNN